MRAIQIMAPGKSAVVELPIPEPGPDEVRVRVVATNTCPQWDLHLAAGEPMFVGQSLPYPYTPGQPGHEMTGVVDAVGREVTGLAVGQSVAAWRDAGHGRQGCYAEYVLMRAADVLAVPAELEPRQVASLELAMCVSVCLLDLLPMDAIAGRRAGVNGLGPAGLIAAQLLRAEGASRVVGFEPNVSRREFAVGQGLLDEAWDPTEEATAAAAPPRRPGPAALDVVIDCCGFPQAVRWIMDRTARHLAFFAVQRHDYVYAPAHAGLTLVGYSGHRREAAEYALAKIVAGQLDLRPLVSLELPFERYAEGVELLRRQEAIKVSFRP